jgi:glycosyltransferase involved in cell wall biosynthesis
MAMTSFIICSIDPMKFRFISMAIAQRMAGVPHEIVGIHDARSMCEGYNRGIARAKGEHLVFCHDDIDLLSPEFSRRLAIGLEQYDLVGVAGTDRLIAATWTIAGPPHIFGQVAHYHPDAGNYVIDQYGIPRRIIGNIQAVDGLFFAVRRHVLEKIRFDEETFRDWHFYDIDFTFSAHLAGFRLAICCDIPLMHASFGKFSTQWQENAALFLNKHGPRLSIGTRRQFHQAVVVAADKAEALALMTPWWWDAPPPPPQQQALTEAKP